MREKEKAGIYKIKDRERKVVRERERARKGKKREKSDRQKDWQRQRHSLRKEGINMARDRDMYRDRYT